MTILSNFETSNYYPVRKPNLKRLRISKKSKYPPLDLPNSPKQSDGTAKKESQMHNGTVM